MPPGPKRICLVSSLHLSYNPRLLKEADALSEAGYGVRVVAMDLEPAKASWDQRLMSSRRWRLETLNARRDNLAGRFTWLKGGLRQRLHQRSAWLRARGTGREQALCRHFPEMCRLAGHEPADLFIGHNLEALPVAASAARRWGAKLGFDAEDFHRGEISENDAARAPLRNLIIGIEQAYIPRCDYLSAASDGIGEAYAQALGAPKPVTILNVFPLSDRAGRTPLDELQQERPEPGLSLYWYSQVIGGDRGLHDVLKALAALPAGFHLRLRGAWARGYEGAFRKAVRALGVERRVHALPPAPPEQLIERAAQHDVGLALEPGNRPNNCLAASNKLFAYFLAGLAVAATDVPGQRAVLEAAPEAGFLFKPGDADALGRNLRRWFDSPTTLHAVKERSRSYGEAQFCWDREKMKLVAAVESAVRPEAS